MLGGFADETADIDIKESLVFLKNNFDLESKRNKRVIDVGGGIGRVSKELLNKYFQEIDLLDQSEK
jgi:ubiquinone/menaquinone biosynthesis C-methylase UbiE